MTSCLRRDVSFLLLLTPMNHHKFSSLKQYPFITSAMLVRSPGRFSRLLCLESLMATKLLTGPGSWLETLGEDLLSGSFCLLAVRNHFYEVVGLRSSIFAGCQPGVVLGFGGPTALLGLLTPPSSKPVMQCGVLLVL